MQGRKEQGSKDARTHERTRGRMASRARGDGHAGLPASAYMSEPGVVSV
jgi:hypothetical protein